jgi:hypothetical protein
MKKWKVSLISIQLSSNMPCYRGYQTEHTGALTSNSISTGTVMHCKASWSFMTQSSLFKLPLSLTIEYMRHCTRLRRPVTTDRENRGHSEFNWNWTDIAEQDCKPNNKYGGDKMHKTPFTKAQSTTTGTTKMPFYNTKKQQLIKSHCLLACWTFSLVFGY